MFPTSTHRYHISMLAYFFIELILGLVRIGLFFDGPSTDAQNNTRAATPSDSRAVGGFVLDWISSLAATLLGLFIALTALILVFACIADYASKKNSQVHSSTDDTAVGTAGKELEKKWKSKRVHRLIQLSCNCPCYKARPRLRFIVRLVYLSGCFLLRIIAISLYASTSYNTTGGGALAGVCFLSLVCLALILSLDLYHYCVWWHYRPSCDNRKCSKLSKKHKRYIPYHLLGEHRTEHTAIGNVLIGHRVRIVHSNIS